MSVDIGAGLHNQSRIAQAAADNLINIPVINFPADKLIALGRGRDKGKGVVSRLIDLIRCDSGGAFAFLHVSKSIPVIFPPGNGFDLDIQPKVGINSKIAEEGIISVVCFEPLAVKALKRPFPVDEIIGRRAGGQRAQIAGLVEIENIRPSRAFAVSADEDRTVAAAQTSDQRELIAAGVFGGFDIYQIIQVMGAGVGNRKAVGVGGAGSKDLIVIRGMDGRDALIVIICQMEKFDISIGCPNLLQVTGNKAKVIDIDLVGRFNQRIRINNGSRHNKSSSRCIHHLMFRAIRSISQRDHIAGRIGRICRNPAEKNGKRAHLNSKQQHHYNGESAGGHLWSTERLVIFHMYLLIVHAKVLYYKWYPL